MNFKINEENLIPQFLINSFKKENVDISMDEAKLGVAYPLPQSIKQILTGKNFNNKRNGIYEYEIIDKIHNHFLLELVKYFELNQLQPKKSKKIKIYSETKRNLKEIPEAYLEKRIANKTLKRLGWLK